MVKDLSDVGIALPISIAIEDEENDDTEDVHKLNLKANTEAEIF